MVKNMIKKFACLCLCVLVIALSLPMGAFVGSAVNAVEVTQGGISLGYFASFAEGWQKALSLAPVKGDKDKTEVVVKLTADLIATDGSFGEGEGFLEGAISVPEGKIITIDLCGYDINRGLTKAVNNGAVIYVQKDSNLTITDTATASGNEAGIITGGNNSGNGGGLVLGERALVTVQEGKISGNTAENGGGVSAEGKGAKLVMSETAAVCNNTVKVNFLKGGIGGGILANAESVTFAGGNVYGNDARYGGGIYVSASCTVTGVNISDNTAENDGGGVYMAADTSLSLCKVTGNECGKNGGGVYAYVAGCSADSCEITGNSAIKTGDGVYVASGCTFSVSGKLIVKDNGEENLYFEAADLSTGTMGDGSEVYLSFKSGAESYTQEGVPFVSSVAGTGPEYFFSDETGYYVTRQSDPAKPNYRYLYFAEGERPYPSPVEHKTTTTDTAYGTYDADNGSYPLYKGLFEFADATGSENYYASTFYYSDGYFDADPSKYNSHLATMSMGLAMSAFAKNSTAEEKYLNQFANVKKLMSDIGCADEDIYINSDFIKKPELYGEDADRLSTIGVAIGNKRITVGGEEYVLIPVAVRGAGYEIEWGSNVTLGAEGEATGFSDAAIQTVALVEDYIKNYGLEDKLSEGKIKFWLTGYSRASATANIAAKRLTDKYGMNNDIFAYCFEVPQGASDSTVLKEEWTYDGGYYNIHNLINKADFVTMVGTSEMGLKRYGVDHYVPGNPELLPEIAVNTVQQVGGTTTVYSDNTFEGYTVSYDPTSPYYNQRQKMLTQLKSVNPNIQFEDYFHEATINYIGFATGLKDLISEVGEQITPDAFLEEFFGLVQDWGLSSESEGNFRKYYATYKPWDIDWGSDKPESLGYFDTDMSVQDAVGVAIGLIFGKSDEESDAIMESLINSAMSISAVSFDGISLLEVYMDYVGKWQEKTPAEKVEMGNRLIDAILTEPYPGAGTVLDHLSEEEGEELLDALPVLLDLALTVLGEDYVYKKAGDTQVMLGTFAYNINTLIMAHYPEINLAWLRSYDSFFDSETDSHIVKADMPSAPTGTCLNGTLSLTAEKGSAIYYSLDGEQTWNLYMKPTAVDSTATGKVRVFTMLYGQKSNVSDINVVYDSSQTTSPQGSDTTQPSDEGGVNPAVVIGVGTPTVGGVIALAFALLKKKKKL